MPLKAINLTLIQTDCVRKERLMTVGICVALDVHVLSFKSSSASRYWLQVHSSRNSYQVVTNAIQH